MLKYQLDTLDGVDEAQAGLYKETEGGGFVLQVEGAVSAADHAKLQQKAVDAAEEAARRRRANEKWQALGDSPDDVRAKLDAKAKPNEDHERLIAEINAKHADELGGVRKQLTSVMMDGARDKLKASLAEVKFHPEILDDIAQTAMQRVQIDDAGSLKILSADGSKPLAGSGSDGYATFGDLAKELAAAKPSFLVDAGKGGGGKPPASNGGSPAAKTVTRTEFDAMSQLARRDFSTSGGKVVD
jgi:microcompartment protein CcmL/EutN